MGKWFLRGLVLAALMVVIRLIQGMLINAVESKAGLISLTLVVLFVIPVIVWGHADGRADATANTDPDRRDDLAMTWLGAGLAAGLLSGLVASIIALFDKALYVGTFFNELTSFAAFTTLLVFVPAVGAVTLGRRHVDRNYTKVPQHHHGLALHDEAQPATDVFATVGAASVADVSTQADAGTQADTSTTLAGPATGFTTEEIPADTGATTEIPAVEDNGPANPAG